MDAELWLPVSPSLALLGDTYPFPVLHDDFIYLNYGGRRFLPRTITFSGCLPPLAWIRRTHLPRSKWHSSSICFYGTVIILRWLKPLAVCPYTACVIVLRCLGTLP